MIAGAGEEGAFHIRRRRRRRCCCIRICIRIHGNGIASGGSRPLPYHAVCFVVVGCVRKMVRIRHVRVRVS